MPLKLTEASISVLPPIEQGGGLRPFSVEAVWHMRALQRLGPSLLPLARLPVHSDRSFASHLAEARACGHQISQDIRQMRRYEVRLAEPILMRMGMERLQPPRVPPKVVAVVAREGANVMRTYPVLTKDGSKSAAFEVENVYIGLRTISRLLRQVAGVTEVRPRQLFSGADDVHVEFKYMGTPFIVWEPYGDSSRYWIGPKDGAEAGAEGAALEQIFSSYRPPLYRSIIGDVLTLRFMRWGA